MQATCQENETGKDQIYEDELQLIADEQFASLTGGPKADSLGFRDGNGFDLYIRGWTRYWNDIFEPTQLLDSNFVKALIATESGFDPTKTPQAGKKIGRARGLMQVTDQSWTILGDNHGELKDHIVHVEKQHLLDPNFNIAAGIRWLFRKKEIADARLGRSADWFEVVALYKAYPIDHEQILKLRKLYERLTK